MNYHIEEALWEKICAVLDEIPRLHTENKKNLRRFIEAVWYIARSGCQWRLLPNQYGNWRAVHRRFKRWAERKVWEILFKSTQIDEDYQSVMIDSTIIRAHACAAGYKKNSETQEALGRSKGGFTSKVHVLVDGLGNPLRFILTPGQRQDVTQAENLTESIFGTPVIADKGYTSKKFIQYLEKKACMPVIPSKKNAKDVRVLNKDLYRERHLVECFFSKVKHFRRIFSRFDKTALCYMAFLCFVSAIFWLK